ncbi:MAG: DUF4234 domain-containing protein [Nocardioides sp.]|nr:DUF4234 domain-containing protein [Nocardioides sp.]
MSNDQPTVPAPTSAPPFPAPSGPASTAYAGGVPVGAPHGHGPVGKIRSTGTCLALMVVTLGIYSLVWFFKVHKEMKLHTNQGLGGGVALLLSIVVGFVMPFFTASEVGKLYISRGQRAPVAGVTGLWYLLLGWFFLVGVIVWFVKVNGALNNYWSSHAASGSS